MIKALRDLNENLQIKINERTQALNEANYRLEELATKDALTGLYNRRHFDIRCAEEFERAKRYGRGLIMVMLDVDHFKQVNDRYGHPVGDEVLIKIGAYLQTAVRDSDLLARFGGEEFCLLLPECSDQVSLAFLDRIRVEIAELQYNANGSDFNVSCSFGVAYMDESVRNKEALLSNADIALYKAKQAGRNRVMQFSNENKVTAINGKPAK